MSSARQEGLQEAPLSTNTIHRVVSEEAASTAQSIFNFRPAANFLGFVTSPIQKVVSLGRFYLLCCTTNMSPYIEVGRPVGDVINWALINPSLYVGKALYSLVSTHPQDLLDNLRSQGRGYLALGLLVLALKTAIATVPCALIGLGFGYIPPFVSPVFARMIAAAISPWIYIAVEKLILDRIFPPAQMKKTTQAPPLHFLQRVGILGFTVYDATKLWMFVHILLREFKEYGHVKEALSSPYILSGVLLIYLLLNYIIDPYIFGPRPLQTPPPFEIRVPVDETLQQHPKEVAPLLANDELAALHNEFDDIPDHKEGDAAIGTHEEVMCDKAKAGAIFAALAILSIGAGLGTSLAAAKLVGDPELLSDTAWQATVAVPCAVMAVTQIALTNAAPWVIKNARSCWASFFNPEPSEFESREVEPLLVDDAHPVTMNSNNAPAAPVLPLPATVQPPESKPWYSRAASSCMSFFSGSSSGNTFQQPDLSYPSTNTNLRISPNLKAD